MYLVDTMLESHFCFILTNCPDMEIHAIFHGLFLKLIRSVAGLHVHAGGGVDFKRN